MKARMRRMSVSVDSAMTPDENREEQRSSDGTECSFQDRVRKLLSSPLSRRRSASNAATSCKADEKFKLKVFGSPLSTLAHVDHPPPTTSTPRLCVKEPGIPYVITRLCQYIERESGLNQEGIFRISANVKLVERLKNSFDECGDAPLEGIGDVAAAAALLKLYLRELPQPVIPNHLNQPFFAAVRDVNHGQSNGRERLKALVAVLPNENFHILKYLCNFLHQVSLNEETNRMNASSLGIVFGPNVFRVSSEDYKEYKDQAISGPNQVVSLFISESGYIFDEELRKRTGVLKICDLETAASASMARKRGKVKRRGASEGEADTVCQPLNSHIIPLLILNNETLSTPMSPKQQGSWIASKRRESKFLGPAFPFCRSSSEERPPTCDDSLAPLPGDIRRCVSSDGMSLCPQKTLQLSGSNDNLSIGKLESFACPLKATSTLVSEAVTQDLDQKSSNKQCKGTDNQLLSREGKTANRPSELNLEEEKRKDFPSPEPLPIIVREHRNSWPREQRSSSRSNFANLATSPTVQSTRIRELGSLEVASISPSAFRSYLSQRSQGLSDHDIAPSPPQDQEFVAPAKRSLATTTFHASLLKDTKMRIQFLKTKLKEFQETAGEKEDRSGLSEDNTGSASCAPLVQELLKLRQKLRELKEDSSIGDLEGVTSENAHQELCCRMERLFLSMGAAEKEMQCRRASAKRPELLDTMTKEQLLDEKVDLQKILLKFESMHGRPTSKKDRNVMRPLYDRYRTVKRLVSGTNVSQADQLQAPNDLPPILEHVVMVFPSLDTNQSADLSRPKLEEEGNAIRTEEKREVDWSLLEQKLHEKPYEELTALLKECRTEKHRLRHSIKDFEEDFKKKTGKKAERGDIGSELERLHTSYKYVKGKSRLLEALVKKSEKSQRGALL